MEQFEPTERTETLLYEGHDFPVIKQIGKNIGIDWLTLNQSNITERIEEGTGISEDDACRFKADFRNLKRKYQLGSCRILWSEGSDGKAALEGIISNPCEASWMWLYTGEYDQSNCNKRNQYLTKWEKVSLNNIANPLDAMFYIECLAEYYKYLGISFPHISSHIVGSKDITICGRSRSSNIFRFSFELPFNDNFDYQKHIRNFAREKRIPVRAGKNGIFFKSKKLVLLKENSFCEKYWEAKDLESLSASILLFDVLSKAMKK